METLAAGSLDLFIPKTYDIVWSLVILVALALFFYKLFLPKFQGIFDERSTKIQSGLDNAKNAEKIVGEAEKTRDKTLEEARRQAATIRDDARAEASNIITDARSRAETEASRVTDNAQKSIESQQQQAMVKLKGEVGVMAMALAGKILRTKLADDVAQSAMVDSMLDDMGGADSAQKSPENK